MKRAGFLGAAGVLGLLLGLFVVPAVEREFQSGPQITEASWASRALTVAEETAEAELIVHVRAEVVPPARAVLRPLPKQVHAPGRPTIDALPFTDTTMRVLEVFKGTAGDRIVVSQTGGLIPGTASYPRTNVVLKDDRLYVVGGEHVLFLVSLGEVVGKRMYATINPAGRYDIRGSTVSSPAEFFGRYSPPTKLDELTTQIHQALRR